MKNFFMKSFKWHDICFIWYRTDLKKGYPNNIRTKRTVDIIFFFSLRYGFQPEHWKKEFSFYIDALRFNQDENEYKAWLGFRIPFGKTVLL